MGEGHTIPLPPGVTVREEFCIGAQYIYEGRVIFQHPSDTDAARTVLWSMGGVSVPPTGDDG